MESENNPVANVEKDDQSRNVAVLRPAERGQWANKTEYLLSVIGEIIGLGNVWRFPYLCFKNGGGAFLIPYFLFLLFCGIPLFFLEVSLGQLTGQGAITCWRKLCPLFEGLGYGGSLIMLYTVMYYIVILAWGLLYLFSSFHSVLPWATCNNTWNTENCADFNMNISSHVSKNATSSVEEFWKRRILGLSGGIEEMGSMRWDLVGCLAFSWIICFFCLFKGIRTTGKVVYFTATFPYLMLIALLIRGLTLPGAANGVHFYLNPDLTRLADPQVWMDAGSQILFSYALCTGCLQTMGSFNKYNNNCYIDAVALCALNSLTSFVAGFAVFGVLGFMSKELGVDISQVAESGPGLAFIAYPQAVALMPLPWIWAICFFMMIIFLGLDSEFVYLEALVSSMSDLYPSFFYPGHRRKVLLLLICAVSFLAGLFMVMEGGLYVFLLFDYYACTGAGIMFFAILETVCVGWIFGADRYYGKIKEMIGFQPRSYMKYCWRFLSPCIITGILIFSLFNFPLLRYDKTYEYPWWGYAIGIFLTSSSILVVPLISLHRLAVTQGSLKMRLKALCTPSSDLLTASTNRHTPNDDILHFDKEMCPLN